jgi:hypothetical protein
MPITNDERREHLEKFGLTSLDTMHTADYRKALEEEAFFWDDPHGFIMHTLSGERSLRIQNSWMLCWSI